MGFIDIIRKEFDIENEMTLEEIYEKISKNPEVTINSNEIHHRIRSAIYHLKKTKEIVRTGKGTYKKLGLEKWH